MTGTELTQPPLPPPAGSPTKGHSQNHQLRLVAHHGIFLLNQLEPLLHQLGVIFLAHACQERRCVRHSKCLLSTPASRSHHTGANVQREPSRMLPEHSQARSKVCLQPLKGGTMPQSLTESVLSTCPSLAQSAPPQEPGRSLFGPLLLNGLLLVGLKCFALLFSFFSAHFIPVWYLLGTRSALRKPVS